MGGLGSGRPSSFGCRAATCEDYLSIDIAWMKRQGLLTPGRSGSMKWSRAGAEIASVGYTVTDAGLRLKYRSRYGQGEWTPVDELIPFAKTSTCFGGQRYWFVCPSCSQRCRIIYGGQHYRCRRCHGLRYESQYEPAFARAASQAIKIQRKLGGDGGVDDWLPPKPKGMHWATYHRLEDRYERLSRYWAAGAYAFIRRLDGLEG